MADSVEIAETVDDLMKARDREFSEGNVAKARELDRQADALRGPNWP